MSGLMDPQPPSGRGPPAPLATQGPNVAPPQGRAGNNASMGRSSYFNDNSSNSDGISIKESNFGVPGFEPPQPASKSNRRPDMKGPGDITDILSGLKTKTINIQESQINNDSTISISDLKDLQSDGNMPKKSKRRPKSDKNTISLDI